MTKSDWTFFVVKSAQDWNDTIAEIMVKGGGVLVENVSFNMNGGMISNNTTIDGNGGGVYVQYDGTFIMTNGTISGNSVNRAAYNRYGGGVCIVSDGTFTKTGGIIFGNDGSTNRNFGSTEGHAVYYFGTAGPAYYRNTTIEAGISTTTLTTPPWNQ